MNDPRPRSILPTVIALILIGMAGLALAVVARPQRLAASAESVTAAADFRTEIRPWGIAFIPKALTPSTPALIIYPEALVPPAAFSYLGAALAAEGHLVAIARFPLNLAWLSPWKAGEIQAEFPGHAAWNLAGIGLGARIAARWARGQGAGIRGLAMLGAAPSAGMDLSRSGLRLLVIAAEEDPGTGRRQLDAARPFMPPDARVVSLAGADHAQFGEYLVEGGARTATMAADRQRAATASELRAFLEAGG